MGLLPWTWRSSSAGPRFETSTGAGSCGAELSYVTTTGGLGYKMLMMVMRRTSSRVQHLGVTMHTESCERVTRVNAVFPTILYPAGLEFPSFAGAAGLDRLAHGLSARC